MDLFHNLAIGFGVAFTPWNLMFAFIGAMTGTLIGVLPGIGPIATIAMLLPLTFHLEPTTGLIMLAGIFYGAQYGGSTTAILVNLPGETSAVVTCLDGHQMARQGRAGAALAIAALGSFFAGCVSTGLIAMFAPPLAKVGQSFGAPEYFSLMVLGLIGVSTMVHCAPLTHGSGSKVLTFLAIGARNVILPRFEPELFARAIETHGGTHSFMVPTMLQMLFDAGPSVHKAVQSMRQISFGGAPITNTLFARALDAFGPILTQVYGTCEAPHPVTVLRPDDYVAAPDPSALAETAGRASLASEIRVADDAGELLPGGGEGELLVRGEYVMQRYWRDEEATAEVFDRDGWYKTGDIAVIDKVGFVRFKDRKRDLIISGGLNVYPSEVERVLAPHPNVREVAVIGYPDDRWGKSVMACVVPRDPARCRSRTLSIGSRSDRRLQEAAQGRVHERIAEGNDQQGAQTRAAGEAVGRSQPPHQLVSERLAMPFPRGTFELQLGKGLINEHVQKSQGCRTQTQAFHVEPREQGRYGHHQSSGAKEPAQLP